MSVLCCRIPNFPIAVACRQHPAWADKPLALLGPDERVWAVSAAAERNGVQTGMQPRQAQLHCPEIHLHPFEAPQLQPEQSAFEEALAAWALPVELQTWGAAYVDLHGVAGGAAAVQPLARELGRRLRNSLGDTLQPALGWDSGKFTAQAAASQAPPGRMRLVGKADEVHFLAPLPVTLLPLARPHLQQLHWLGVHTLGQFARLPPAAVWQRFGAAGKLAQRWAQGRDERPVRAAVAQAPAPVTVLLDPPAAQLQPVVAAAMASLTPALAAQATLLEGVRRLRVVLAFVTGDEHACESTFVEAASQPGRVQAALVQQFCRIRWPAEVEAVRWVLLETGELAAPQLTLFAESPPQQAALREIAEQLGSRYGARFFQGQVEEQGHPLPERRSRFLSLADARKLTTDGAAPWSPA